MKLDKKENQVRLIDQMGESVTLNSPINSAFVLIDKYGYEQCYVQHERVRISKERLKTDFEVVENFSVIDYSKSKGTLSPIHFLYRHLLYDFYLTISRDGYLEEEDSNDSKESIGDSFKKVAVIYYKSGDEQLNEVVNSLNELLDFNYDSSAKVSLVLKTAKGFEFKEVAIKPMPVDVDTMYNDDFKEPYKYLVEQLESGNKGVALLYGGAGTGKSNLIRHLTKEIPSKRFVFIPVTMINFLTDPMFLSTLIDNKGAILVLEDCENYIKDRKAGDANSVVSSILNLTDGILSDVLGLQLICTFNNSIHDVDKALLRKGRLICEYEFKELTPDKAINLLKDIGVDTGNTPLNKIPKTLAEIYNYSSPSSNINVTKKIGFGSSN